MTGNHLQISEWNVRQEATALRVVLESLSRGGSSKKKRDQDGEAGHLPTTNKHIRIGFRDFCEGCIRPNAHGNDKNDNLSDRRHFGVSQVHFSLSNVFPIKLQKPLRRL